MKRVAIIGAGVAGAAAAYALRETSSTLTIFEKSRGFSGRAATRRRDGIYYDHGANHFKTDHERVHRIVREELSVIGLTRIDPDVWTFDGGGTIEEGDPERNEEPKWSYRTGIHRLGKRLALASEADIHLETRITHMRQEEDGRWKLEDQNEEEHGAYNVVLMTPPAPQSAQLLGDADALSEDDVQQLADTLDSVPYRKQLTVVLGYDERLERPGSFYGLINTDGEHDALSWLSFEEDKAGHVPDGQSVVIAQMTPDWSAPRLDDPSEDDIAEAAQEVATLLGEDAAANPDWTDTQRWRYALPEDIADADALKDGKAKNLFFAGDALAGTGRVQAALETGLDVAERIEAHGEA
jgi:predicted NAD/FAD-dependent oxidoreductase